ncbi:PaaX family transcriptional regulator C-terminal domain-containing protein [Streptomyces sp. NPDC058274]|uniref:PaaX family transcriptional regulator n=1 Tax=Streptomyces sp. NPDC058274 TaxID=3346416 RepID=UPI0036F0C182
MPVTSLDPAPRPQSLMLSFFGIHVRGRDIALSSSCVIDAFARIGITEEAVRSTLTRMVNRGLLERHRQGRKMYFALTPRAAAVLQDGHDRIWRTGAVNRDWDGQWTLVGFSLPEAWRRERHDLRSRLTWGGFGPLQSGLWVAPGEVDVAALVAGLGLDAQLRVFRGTVIGPTEVAQVLESAFDTKAIAAEYRAFLDRWTADDPADAPQDFARDPFAGQLLLHTDWLELVRRDPHLPAEHLPADWPAIRAEALFQDLARRCAAPARAEAERVLDAIPTGG